MTIVELGHIIKQRRKVLMISQLDLAEMAGISLNTVYKIERGLANPTVAVLNKITEILGMEIILDVKKQNL